MKHLLPLIITLTSFASYGANLQCRFLIEGTSDRNSHDSTILSLDTFKLSNSVREFKNSIEGVGSYTVRNFGQSKLWISLTGPNGVSTNAVFGLTSSFQQSLRYSDDTYPDRKPVTALVTDSNGNKTFYSEIFGFDLTCTAR